MPDRLTLSPYVPVPPSGNSVIMTSSIKVSTQVYTNATNATDTTNQLQIVTNRLNAQSRVSRMLARAKTLNAAVEGTLKILCETFSWRFGEYWKLDKQPSSLRQTLCWDVTSTDHTPYSDWTFQRGEGLPGHIWETEQPTYFPNLTRNPDFLRRDFALEMGLRHGYGFPVCDRTGLVGVITFLTQTDQPLDENLMDLLLLLGEQLGLFIQRKSDEIQLRQYADRLEVTLQELKRTQSQVIQSEKMSSIGQLVAGIAHEINNPANFIHGNIRPAQDYQTELFQLLDLYEQEYPKPNPAIIRQRNAIDLAFLRQDFPQLLESMRNGSDRIRDIVKSLRNFSRLDEAAVKEVNLHEGLDSTLMILNSRLKSHSEIQEVREIGEVRRSKTMQAIQVVKHYEALPLIQCYAGQVNQIFMNVLVNAVDAFEEAGLRDYPATRHPHTPTITIITTVIAIDWIRVTIADNGPGIPSAHQSQIFNPFFTTKPVGKGTGLGLSISYQIATEIHGGRFYCESELGEGTRFVLELPVVCTGSTGRGRIG